MDEYLGLVKIGRIVENHISVSLHYVLYYRRNFTFLYNCQVEKAENFIVYRSGDGMGSKASRNGNKWGILQCDLCSLCFRWLLSIRSTKWNPFSQVLPPIICFHGHEYMVILYIHTFFVTQSEHVILCFLLISCIWSRSTCTVISPSGMTWL